MNNKDNLTAKRQLARAKADCCIGSFTGEEWHNVKAKYGYVCVKCLTPDTDRTLIPDHVVPLGEGGANFIGNIQPLCRNCNTVKGVSKGYSCNDYRPEFGKKILYRIVKNSLTSNENEDYAPGEYYALTEKGKFKLKWLIAHFGLTWQCDIRRANSWLSTSENGSIDRDTFPFSIHIDIEPMIFDA